MTREDALEMLVSGSNHERLKAARFLMRNAQISDVAALRKARQAETISYVKTSLDVGIARLSNLPVSAQPDPTDEFEVAPAIKRRYTAKR